jgi:Family of unknown function (DUF5898)
MSKYENSAFYHPTLEEGLPPVKRHITETGASIPTDAEHVGVKFYVKPFGLLSDVGFNDIKKYKTDLVAKKDEPILYASENDIAILVVVFLRSVLTSFGLADYARVFTEVGVFRIRPDAWVVTAQGVPVGVVEVKKPDAPGKPSALNHPNVLGELYDFMARLKNFYGIAPVFGLLTNFVSWRVAWLPKDGCDGIAAQEESYNGPHEFTSSNQTKTHPTPAIHKIEEGEDDNEDTDGTSTSVDDHLHVSKIYHQSDGNTELVRAVASCLLKMLRAKHSPIDLNDLSDRRLIKFQKGENGSICWTPLTLNDGIRWDITARATNYLYALQDLGYGAHGRVWLACTRGGSVCVLKFSSSANPDRALEAEKKAWDEVYGAVGIKVHLEKWSGHAALRMPHFAPVDPNNRANALPLVEETLKNHFHANGVKHKDVAWRNIGMFIAADGNERAVVFDMGSVSSIKDDNGWVDNGWVDQAVQHLLGSIST